MSEDRADAPCDPDPDEMAAREWAALRRELLAPRLRWLASGLAILSCGLLVWWTAAGREPTAHFPIHARGPAAWFVVGGAAVLWVGSAVGLWAWRLRSSGRGEPERASSRARA